MSESKKFAYDVGITFFASVANVIISFVIIILLGKFVGANDLGLYRFINTLFSLTLLISLFGIPTALIKYVAENKENNSQLNELVSSGIITWSYIFQGMLFGLLGSVLGILLTKGVIFAFTKYPIITPIGDLVPIIGVLDFVIVSVVILLACGLTGYFVSKRITKEKTLDLIYHG